MKYIITLIFIIFGVSSSYAQSCNTSMTLVNNNALYVTLINNSTPASSGTIRTTYIINWGDNTTQSVYNNSPVAHVYSGPGTYSIKLVQWTRDTVTNASCMDSVVQNISVSYPPCYTPPTHIAQWNKTYTFTATNPGNTTGMSYSWDFGDGNTGSGSPVTHQYTGHGWYHIKLYASSTNCSDTFNDYVYIDTNKNCYPDSAQFIYQRINNHVNFTAQVDSTSPGNGRIYFWDFGDGNTSTQRHPQHVYTSTGSYNVMLRVTFIDSNNNATCTDSIAKTINIFALGSISGEVFADSFNVQGDTFKVWLITYNPSTNILTAIDSTTAVSDRGATRRAYFYFSNLSPGSYRVKAHHINGPSIGTGNVPTYHDSSLLWLNADLINHTGGASYADIYMKKGMVINGPGFVGGNVQQGANKGTANGIAGMTVLLLNLHGDPVQFATTDANGDYEFNNIPNGTYTVHPEQLAFTTTTASVNITNGKTSYTDINFERSLTGKTIKPLNNSVENVSGAQLSFSVYPNPARETVHIEWNRVSDEVAHITITDVSGKTVMTVEKSMNTRTELDVTQLNAGFYMLNITTETGRKTQKLLLQ